MDRHSLKRALSVSAVAVSATYTRAASTIGPG